jgi:uncharacterized protein YjiS (DUF1127 family)
VTITFALVIPGPSAAPRNGGDILTIERQRTTMTIQSIAANPAISPRPFVIPTVIARWVLRLSSFHRIRRELSGLSDDLLKDVGLSRCGIDFVAEQSADAYASPAAVSSATMSKRK